MTNREQVADAMPALLLHEGTWCGRYRTVDLDDNVVDEHASRVECVFPDAGPFHYVQHNTFTWDDGRTREVEFGGVLRDERIWWDTDTFSGYGWSTADDVVLLTLQRRDLANTSFTEVIVLGGDRQSRARTWHWFRDGTFYRRTLCDETRE